MTFETIRSEVRYQGRAFSVRQDQVKLPDGHITELDIVEHVGAVTIIPIDADGNIWFVRQYRHAAGTEILELPAGTLEDGENPDLCALRETREEIGMAPGQLQKLGEFYLAPGYSTEYMHVYLATELSPNPLPGDMDEFLSIESYPAEKAFSKVESGEIKDAKSLAALLLLQLHLVTPDL
jgi:ADP-ribose pyrophosphatase